MPIDRDLFLSILALDSYNRGYNEGVVISGSSGLGTATFLQDTNTAPAQQAGFYGIAYNWEGEKIISYRGTDNFGLANDIGGAGASDITTGWTLALGYPGGGQAALAMQFYQTVTGVSSPYFPAPGELTLVGHSLGGALAGLVASLSGSRGVGFDHEPFSLAAWLQ